MIHDLKADIIIAIIQADVNRYAGANKCTLWKGTEGVFSGQNLDLTHLNFSIRQARTRCQRSEPQQRLHASFRVLVN